MNVTLIVISLFVITVLGFRILGFRKKQLKPPEEIIRTIQKEDLSQMANADNPDQLTNDIVDREFYESIHGIHGISTMRKNAVAFCNLCVSAGVSDREDLIYLQKRAFWIALCAPSAILEQFIRLFFVGFPHISARLATGWYWECRLRVLTLCEIHYPQFLESLVEAI